MPTVNSAYQAETRVFRKHGGILTTVEAIREGIHPRDLYAMRDAGKLDRLSRGLYRLSGLAPLQNPDYVVVARRVPEGVLCLISALAFHELTTQIPHEIHIALKKGARPPRLENPPVRTFHFSGKAFTEGVEEWDMGGIRYKVYSKEKTLADCFKCRNVVGLDTTLEALRAYWRGKRKKVEDLARYAKVCRVSNVMRPYLEAVQS